MRFEERAFYGCLYDLERDPHEVENLAYRPEYAAVVESLKNKIRRFQEETGDPWRHKWKYK